MASGAVNKDPIRMPPRRQSLFELREQWKLAKRAKRAEATEATGTTGAIDATDATDATDAAPAKRLKALSDVPGGTLDSDTGSEIDSEPDQSLTNDAVVAMRRSPSGVSQFSMSSTSRSTTSEAPSTYSRRSSPSPSNRLNRKPSWLDVERGYVNAKGPIGALVSSPIA